MSSPFVRDTRYTSYPTRNALPLDTMTSPTDRTRAVNFTAQPVTSELRPLSRAESWALHHFEHHARGCLSCHNPYARHKEGKRLCNEGHALAQDVAAMLYEAGDGHIYSTERPNGPAATANSAMESFRVVRVEVPQNYTETLDLLRAINRGARRQRRAPLVSMDRSYPIAPRIIQAEPLPAQDSSRGRHQESSSRHRHRSRRGSRERSTHHRRRQYYYHDDNRGATTSTRHGASLAPIVTVEQPSRSQRPSTRHSRRTSDTTLLDPHVVAWPRESLPASASSTPGHSPNLPTLSYSPDASESESEDDIWGEREAHERRYEHRSAMASLDATRRGSLFASDLEERTRQMQLKDEPEILQPASVATPVRYNVELRQPKKNVGRAGLSRRHTISRR